MIDNGVDIMTEEQVKQIADEIRAKISNPNDVDEIYRVARKVAKKYKISENVAMLMYNEIYDIRFDKLEYKGN